MLETALLGVASSLAAEVVVWLNKKLAGTILQGDGAFLLSFLAALAAAFVKVFFLSGKLEPVSMDYFFREVGVVFSVSQMWFVLIAQKLNLQVVGNK